MDQKMGKKNGKMEMENGKKKKWKRKIWKKKVYNVDREKNST